MIKIDFEMTDGTYTLRDAITLPDKHNFSEAEIEEIKQQRWDNWLKIVATPPPIFDNYQLDENGNVVVDENGMPVILENNNG